MTVIGNDNTTNNGLTNIFKSPKTTAAINATQTLETWK